jgi:lysophospholipid acyltransferase (LPLAT)-like uncharacterized protein
MTGVIEQAAFAWGSLIAHYSLSAVRPERTHLVGREHLGPGACIFVGWHRINLLGLACHQQQIKRPCLAFAPPGLPGATMSGWLTGTGFTVVRLPEDGKGNAQAALKQMARALRQGLDVVIALDGPHGPAEIARPGALWLARLTGCPLVSTGFAASPSFSLPRWDRHVVPLPGARVCAVMGEPMVIGRDEPVDEAHLEALAERAHDAIRLARRVLATQVLAQPAANPAAGQPIDSAKGPQ